MYNKHYNYYGFTMKISDVSSNISNFFNSSVSTPPQEAPAQEIGIFARLGNQVQNLGNHRPLRDRAVVVNTTEGLGNLAVPADTIRALAALNLPNNALQHLAIPNFAIPEDLEGQT